MTDSDGPDDSSKHAPGDGPPPPAEPPQPPPSAEPPPPPPSEPPPPRVQRDPGFELVDDGLDVPPPPPPSSEEGDDEHLTELRYRILMALAWIAVAACVTLYYSGPLTRMILSTASKVQFIALSPMEIFFTEMKIGLLA